MPWFCHSRARWPGASSSNSLNLCSLRGPLENSPPCHSDCSLMVGLLGAESWSGSVVRGGGEQTRKGPIQAQDQGTLSENSAWLKGTMDEAWVGEPPQSEEMASGVHTVEGGRRNRSSAGRQVWSSWESRGVRMETRVWARRGWGFTVPFPGALSQESLWVGSGTHCNCSKGPGGGETEAHGSCVTSPE